MNPTRIEAADLTASWQRFDWRESFFAPQVGILQALTLSGATASGVGPTRDHAFRTCLGETAEIYALASNPDLRAGFIPFVAGLAAHETAGKARDAAFLEAVERHVISQWWLGHLSARPMDQGWLDQTGITRILRDARHGAAVKRLTGFWVIEADGPVVVVSHSMSPRGQERLVGFGADRNAAAAARKALYELFLMEMNLMELMAERNVGPTPPLLDLQRKIATYTRRCPTLLPDHPYVTPDAALPPSSAGFNWSVARVALSDVTPPGSPLQVWLCRPELSAPPFDEHTGTPFF